MIKLEKEYDLHLHSYLHHTLELLKAVTRNPAWVKIRGQLHPIFTPRRTGLRPKWLRLYLDGPEC